MTVTDYADYNTAAEHARQISVTGAPLLTLQSLGATASGQALIAGASFGSPNMSITQPGYDFTVILSIAGGSTAPWVRVRFLWTDTALGASILETDTFYLAPSNLGTNQYSGRGITKGNLLKVVVTNLDTVATVTFTYGVSQMSRVPLRDDIRSTDYNDVPGFSVAPNSPRSNALALWSVLVNAGTTQSVLLPLFAGRARISMTTIPQTCGVTLRARGEGADTSLGVVNDVFYDSGPLAANSRYVDAVTLPRSNCQLLLANTSAANGTFKLGMIAEEY